MLRKKAQPIPAYNKVFWGKFYEGIINNQGKAFTIVEDFATQQTSYNRVKGGIFRNSDVWKKSQYGNYSFYPDIDLFCKPIPSECSVIREFVTLSDERDTSTDSTAIKRDGYRLTINVPGYFATEVYKKRYADIGVPFKERLLTHHRKFMDEITTYNDNNSTSRRMNKSRPCRETIYICVNGITDSSPYDAELIGPDKGLARWGILFSEYNMPNLGGISQCYGMALAIIAKLKPKWEKEGTVAIHISECNSNNVPYLKICYDLKQQAPQPLGEW